MAASASNGSNASDAAASSGAQYDFDELHLEADLLSASDGIFDAMLPVAQLVPSPSTAPRATAAADLRIGFPCSGSIVKVSNTDGKTRYMAAVHEASWMIDEAQYAELKARATAASAAEPRSSGPKVGAYTPRSRRRRIERWHAKRKKLRAAPPRGAAVTPLTAERRSFANSRPRLNGRFLPLNTATTNQPGPVDASKIALTRGPPSSPPGFLSILGPPQSMIASCPPLSEQERALRQQTRPASPFTASSSSSDSDAAASGNSDTGLQGVRSVTVTA